MTWDPSGHYAPARPQRPAAGERLSGWEKIRRWPLPGKVLAIVFGVPLILFVLLMLLGVVLVLLGVGGEESSAAESEPEQVVAETETPPASGEPGQTVSDEPSAEASEAAEEASSSSTPSTTRASETPAPSPSPTPTSTPTPTPTSSPAATPSAAPNTHTAMVSRVIDGDTVELASGETVRLLGIDTPERGECHFGTASQAMAGLVLGQSVTLTRDGDDSDHYGRLLRYIDVGNTDAGLTLLHDGLATARYDSRDGYGFHTREPAYIAAQRAGVQQTCAPVAPEPTQPVPAQPPGENCDPNYTPCVPPYPPDINCSDISFRVQIIGSDPHGFDADGDGWGCESNG